MEKKMTDDNKKNIDDASTDLKKSDKKDLSPSKTKNRLLKKKLQKNHLKKLKKN